MVVRERKKFMREMRKRHGKEYAFHRILTDRDVAYLQKQNPKYFTALTVSELIVGCVKIEAVLYRLYGEFVLAYEVYVKDESCASAWVCYDSPDDAVSTKEWDMLYLLNKIVLANNLSYTRCCFERLEGVEASELKVRIGQD